MADEVNYIIYNAPAGSGKTTILKHLLREMHYDNPKSKFLCITYTNRAADEMSVKVSNDYVYSSTIHSFLYDFLKPYFRTNTVISDYIETFKSKIEEKIDNNNPKNAERINRYIEKYDPLDKVLSLETIKNNIKSIDYYEAPFSIYLEGKLSHDDLLFFSSILFKKYLSLNKKLVDKYDYIFIDEYQDTDDLIIELFYNAVKKTSTKLYLFGDRMQQIYKSSNLFLYEHIESFQKRDLKINYRSSSEIVNCLNNIYNDEHFTQKSNKGESRLKPLFILSSNMESTLNDIKSKCDDCLELYLLNREKYQKLGVLELYEVVSDLYPYGSKYSANDILTTLDENPNTLFKYIFCFCDIYNYFKVDNIGMIINTFKNKSFLNQKFVEINDHDDKDLIKKKLISFVEKVESNLILFDFFEYLMDNKIIKNQLDFDEEYNDLLKIDIDSFLKLYTFLTNNAYISTQHGVKGESHKNVVFISGNSNSSPYISTTELYKLLSFAEVSFEGFYDFYNQYHYLYDNITSNQLNAEKIIKDFYNEYKSNKYFEIICKDRFDEYINNSTKSNLKKINKTLVEKVFQAYKLFYVGCSRAMKELYVIVDINEIKEFKQELVSKMTKIGFEVQMV